MRHIEVVAAIIIHQNKILCVQRGENKLEYISKKYEFPGGKMEAGETKEETIKREILEELNMQINVQNEFLTVTHQYPVSKPIQVSDTKSLELDLTNLNTGMYFITLENKQQHITSKLIKL